MGEGSLGVEEIRTNHRPMLQRAAYISPRGPLQIISFSCPIVDRGRARRELAQHHRKALRTIDQVLQADTILQAGNEPRQGFSQICGTFDWTAKARAGWAV